MQNNKLETISNLFEGKEIRSIWDSEKEDYYFSYWTTLKKRLINEESSELPTKCRRLKMKSKKDGKNYLTDTLDTEGILRLIESVPSPKAEPFKLWLARLGKERIDKVFDPEIAINRSINNYRRRGYTDEWIEKRLKGILDRHKLTDIWKEGGITEGFEYALLTNEIYKEWSGMTAKQYKEFKGLRKESLRDNMDDIEVALTDLSETTTRALAKKHKPYGLNANKRIAKLGGEAAKVARDNIEKNMGETIVTNNNKLSYQYMDNQKVEKDYLLETH